MLDILPWNNLRCCFPWFIIITFFLSILLKLNFSYQNNFFFRYSVFNFMIHLFFLNIFFHYFTSLIGFKNQVFFSLFDFNFFNSFNYSYQQLFGLLFFQDFKFFNNLFSDEI